jgi:hypothetical protein
MAQITTFSALYPFILRWLPGCASPFMLRALRDAARHICEVYEVWKEDLDPVVMTNFQQDYTLELPSADPANVPTSYTAYIHRLLEVKVNAIPYSQQFYDLVNGNILRFDSRAVPNNLEDMILQCGTAGSVTIGDWRAITDASLGITVSQGSYSVEDLDFTGLTFPQIALKIQTGLRTEASSNIGFCRWFTNKFKLWVDAGTISELTAGLSGTSISGASWMNGLSGGTGVEAGPLLEVKVVMVPHQSAETLPNWFLDRMSDALIARAIWQLKNMPGPHKDKEGAAVWDTQFKIQMTDLVGDRSRAYKASMGGFGA